MFFRASHFRFGMAIGDVDIMTAKIQKQLQKEEMSVYLVKKDMPLIFIDWQRISEKTVSNRQKYGENSQDEFFNKYKTMFKK